MIMKRSGNGSTSQPSCSSLIEIGRQMQVLGITGDSVYLRIRECIERGMYVEARQQLNFVDRIYEAMNSILDIN